MRTAAHVSAGQERGRRRRFDRGQRHYGAGDQGQAAGQQGR
jgi:hypothetical protein